MGDEKGPLRGVYPYIATPFDGEGRVSERQMRQMIERVMVAGVHGVVPLGSSGELPYMSLEERLRATEICVDEIAGRVPVIPGVFGFSTAETVGQALRAETAGADGVLVVLNAYTQLSDDEVLSYFEAVHDSINLPIVIYHHPRFCRVRITVELALRLGTLPNVVAFKDASGGLDLFSASPELQKLGTFVFAATATSPTAAMLLGGVGWMSGPACVMPAETVAMYELCVAGRWEDSLAVEREMAPVLAYFREQGPAASVKAMLNADGFDVGSPVHPVAMPETEGLGDLLKNARERMNRALAAAS